MVNETNLLQTPFAHATRLIKYRYSMINFTLLRRARIETCLSSLTFAQFLIFNFLWKSFRRFSSVCKIFSYFQSARDESFPFQERMRNKAFHSETIEILETLRQCLHKILGRCCEVKHHVLQGGKRERKAPCGSHVVRFFNANRV